jgi:hypothetical protein
VYPPGRAAQSQSAHQTAKGWTFKRPDPVKGSFERTRLAATVAWQVTAGLATEDYLHAVCPERYGDNTLDAVIADRCAAEAAAILERSEGRTMQRRVKKPLVFECLLAHVAWYVREDRPNRLLHDHQAQGRPSQTMALGNSLCRPQGPGRSLPGLF